MHIEKLVFGHKELLFEKMKKLGIGLSEFSFANLYLFRQVHNHEVLFDEQDIFIRGKTYDGFTYFMPTRDVRDIDINYLRNIMKDIDFLYPVPEEWLVKFDAAEFQHNYTDGDSDYIYTTEKMFTYKGSKLHKKRNLMKQFVESYEHQDYPLIEDRIKDAISVLDEWQNDTGDLRDNTDYYPCLEALKMNKELILCGIIYYANKEPAAFILGEELIEDMFVLKFAKAKKKFKGIYQYIYNNFAHLLPQKYKYFNLLMQLTPVTTRYRINGYGRLPAKYNGIRKTI